MRTVNVAAQAQRELRRGIIEFPMVWVSSLHWQTNEPAGVGMWMGPGTEDITVQDLWTGIIVTRTFHNGAVLEVDSVRHEAGLNIRPITIRLSGISPAVLTAFFAYNPRGAKVQAWKRCYNDEWQPIGVEGWFRGYVNLAPSERPTPEEETSIEVDVVSPARMLTIHSSLKKSHEAQLRRGGDMIRQYKTTTGAWDVPWNITSMRS